MKVVMLCSRNIRVKVKGMKIRGECRLFFLMMLKEFLRFC